MIDRERKRQADRERRERIRNGTWKFPKGGDAEASLGLSSKTALTAQRGSPAAYMPLSPANPGPAPRSIIPEPRGAAPLSRAMAPAPGPSSSRALAIIPTPAPSLPAGKIVKRPRIIGHPEIGEWIDPNARVIMGWQLGQMAHNWRAMCEENDALRQRSEAAERAVAAARQAEADRLAERQERIKGVIGAVAEIFGIAIPKIA